MALTLQELEQIRNALIYGQWSALNNAVKIVEREINQMKQDQLLSESKANPT